MILGPNGTGKSSIACAICLGLNWSPAVRLPFRNVGLLFTSCASCKVLGRATHLKSFVKLGTTEGYIEIELKGPKGKPNLVIRRSLKAESDSSTFRLNGESVTGKEVTNRMAELNVQVGNLWYDSHTPPCLPYE
jgi:chromosome segregation ATPase